MIAETLGANWKSNDGFIGKPFEDIFEFDFNDLPYMIGAQTPGEQALEMRDGKVVFADVKAPLAPLKKSKPDRLSWVSVDGLPKKLYLIYRSPYLRLMINSIMALY